MSHITLKQVRAFVAVAQARNFAEAAEALHLSQPALSSAIKTLEESLGGQLLARTTRTFALTPEGQDFYPRARQLLKDWDDATDNLKSQFALRTGTISIAAMPSFASNLLPQAIGHYRAKHPNVKIALHDVVAEEVVSMVRSGKVELGISFRPQESEDLQFSPLFNDTFVAVVPPQHPLNDSARVTARHLLQNDLITLQPPSQMRQLIETAINREGLQFQPEFESHQLTTIGRMVASSLGVSIVPALCQQQMQELGAHCRPLIRPRIQCEVGIITRRRYPLSAASRGLTDTLRRNFSQTT